MAVEELPIFERLRSAQECDDCLNWQNPNMISQAMQNKIDSLSDEFDALLAEMQTPQSSIAMKSAFDASPEELGKAAIAAARKRG